MTVELWAPDLPNVANPAVPQRYRPPADTGDPRYAACTVHHPACDCREAIHAEDRQELNAYAAESRMQDAAIRGVVLMHAPDRAYYGNWLVCVSCSLRWPCPTLMAVAHVSYLARDYLAREGVRPWSR